MLIWTLIKLISAENVTDSREEIQISSNTCENVIQVQKVNRQFNGFYTKSGESPEARPIYSGLGSDTVLRFVDNRWTFQGKVRFNERKLYFRS